MSRMRLRINLRAKDRTAPAVLKRGLGVPEPRSRIFDRQQFNILAPRQFANDPLENRRIWPSLGECLHVAQVGRGESARVRERDAQIGGEAADDLATPALFSLSFQDVAANAPVEANEFTVDGEGGTQPRLSDLRLQIGKPGRVAGRDRRGAHGLTLRQRAAPA